MADLTILVIIIIAVVMGLTDFFGHKISSLIGGHRDYNLLFFISNSLVNEKLKN